MTDSCVKPPKLQELTLSTSEQPPIHVFTVLGASGDLAKKKIYPTLWRLYRDNLLPAHTYFLGYARTHVDIGELLGTVAYKFMGVKPAEEERYVIRQLA
jgi:glucose-6-phosphate 1-dehydrogenase